MRWDHALGGGSVQPGRAAVGGWVGARLSKVTGQAGVRGRAGAGDAASANGGGGRAAPGFVARDPMGYGRVRGSGANGGGGGRMSLRRPDQ